MVERTEWHSVTFFNKAAKVLAQYLKKGDRLYVEGAIRTRTYEKDDETRYATGITGREFMLLGDKPDSAAAAKPSESKPAESKPAAAPAGDFGRFVRFENNFGGFGDDGVF